jgi:hypothetical protein
MISSLATNDQTWVDTHVTERHAGALAAAAWLAARGLRPHGPDWTVAISLEVRARPAAAATIKRADSRLHIAISASGWELSFRHRGRASRIRVTEVAFVNGGDEHALIRAFPPLRDVGSLVRSLEHRLAISFHRKHASVRTSLLDGEPQIRCWITESF